MFKLKDIDVILNKMKNNKKLNEFIYYVFDYKINKNINSYSIKYIEDDIIITIYENKKKHLIIELVNGICEVYMDKYYYKNILIITIYIDKCIELYNNKNTGKMINYCKAMSINNIKEQKNILSQYIPIDLINIMYKK